MLFLTFSGYIKAICRDSLSDWLAKVKYLFKRLCYPVFDKAMISNKAYSNSVLVNCQDSYQH